MGILHRLQGTWLKNASLSPYLCSSTPCLLQPTLFTRYHWSPVEAWSEAHAHAQTQTQVHTSITIAGKPKDSRSHGIDLNATLGAPTGLGRAEHLQAISRSATWGDYSTFVPIIATANPQASTSCRWQKSQSIQQFSAWECQAPKELVGKERLTLKCSEKWERLSFSAKIKAGSSLGAPQLKWKKKLWKLTWDESNCGSGRGTTCSEDLRRMRNLRTSTFQRH